MSLILNPLVIQRKLKASLTRYLLTRSAISSVYLKEEIKRLLSAEGTIAKSPYLQLLKEYKKNVKLQDITLNDQTLLHPNFSTTVNQDVNEKRKGFNVGWELYLHQEEAIQNAHIGKNIIVASGTGSGKTECFLIPVINRLLHEPRPEGSKGVRCIILYPMNALVNDQIKRIKDWLGVNQRNHKAITFAYYTSKTPNQPKSDNLDKEYFNELKYRTEIRETPPDILVTNYSMLSYILMRPSDRQLFDNALSMIVLDEAHIYSGALATEIRLLIHHLALRCKLRTKKLQFYLTSATLTSDLDSDEQQKNVLKEFASKLTNTDSTSWTAILSKPFIRQSNNIKKDEDIKTLIECARLIQKIVGDKFEENLDFYSIEDDLKKLGDYLGIEFDLDWFEEVLEYGGWDNIKEFINVLSEKLGKRLSSSFVLQQFLSALNDRAASLEELLSLFPQLSQEELILLISLFNFATHKHEQKEIRSLLPYRGHLFFRSPVGLFACSNPHCKPKHLTDQKIGRWKTIFLERNDFCPHCKSKVVELATCNECGLEYVVGKIPNNNASGRLMHLRPRDWLDSPEAQHFLFDKPEKQEWAADLEDEELEAKEPSDDFISKSKNWTEYRFCYQCGIASSIEDGLICECGEDKNIKVLKYLPNKENIGKDHSVSSCPKCRKRKTGSGSPVQKFGGRETVEVTILLSELHQLLPPEAQTEETIASGRKMLVFSDTRSRAAKLAVNMNVNERDILFRSVLLKSLDKLAAENQKQPITFLQLHEEIEHELRQLPIERVLGYDDPEMINWNKVITAILLARISIDSWKRSLEGLGLLNVKVPFEDIDVSELINLSWDEEKVRNLIDYCLWTMRIAHGLYFREMLSLNPNEVYKTILESKYIVGFVKWNKSNKSPRIQNFISNNNRRTKYLEKQQLQSHEIDDLLTKVWNFLKRNGLIVIKPGHFQENQYFLLPTKLNFSKPEILLRCNLCGRIYPHSGHDLTEYVCFNTLCNGRLEQITYDQLHKTLQDNHYFYLYSSNRLPLICREHTAQIGNDVQDIYEKEFARGRVNLLSCSTTMELGIDIGGISTVVGSNVPPRISNYVQRVGRAGRAGSGVAAAITFARAQSYEQYAYENPTFYIGGQVHPPIVEPDLPPVIQRHINLFLVASFFQKSGHAVDFSNNGLRLKDIFESVVNGKSLVDAFCGWLQQGQDEASNETINSFYPAKSSYDDRDPKSIRTELIKRLQELQAEYLTTIRRQQRYINQETNNKRHLIQEKERIENEMVIRHFCYKQVFPQFSFPVDVVSLINVSDINVRNAVDEGEVRLQRDVKLALREYSPGNSVVADGKLFKSHAVRWGDFGTISHQYAKANVAYFQRCPHGHVQISTVSTQEFSTVCPTCKTQIPSYASVEKYLKPTAFSTSYHEEPKVITSVTPFEMGTDLSEPILFDNISIEDRHYISVSGLNDVESYFAPSGKGQILYYTESKYRLCKSCGFCKRKSQINNQKWGEHVIPYRNTKCGSNDFDELRFGTSKITDILYVRINRDKNRKFQHSSDNRFWYTLLQLILETIPNVLNIERNDVDGLIWVNESLQYEMILFDDVPNGAGHMQIVQQNLKMTFDEAQKRIAQDCCDRACPKCLLTFYNQHFDDSLDKNLVIEFFQNYK